MTPEDTFFDLLSPRKAGTRQSPCSGPEAPKSFRRRCRLSVRVDSLECPSFQVCDQHWCGAQLYPVRSCASALGIPVAGQVDLEDPMGMFRAEYHFPVEYGDSVACWATNFVRVPEGLTYSFGRSLDRHLLLSDLPWVPGIHPGQCRRVDEL